MTDTSTRTSDPAVRLLEQWEQQQTGYLPRREERFAVIVDALGSLLGDHFTVLDVGCGPGSLARRVLDAHPGATVLALDSDPLLLEIGRRALTGYGDRLRWVDADLRDADWPAAVGQASVDAAVSTTALHWLTPGALLEFHAEIATVIRPGGVFLNGDNIPFDTNQPACRLLAQQVWDADLEESFGRLGIVDWDRWWEQAEATPELTDVVAERRRRVAARSSRGSDRPASFAVHTVGLAEAGFVDIGTLWQRYDDRVLLARRPA